MLAKHGLGGKLFDPAFARKAIARVAAALERPSRKPGPSPMSAIGKAKVENVASNRRVMGEDGKVKYVRYSSTKDPKIRAEPEGLIDPHVHLLSFHDGDKPLASLTYYATHPQSYYGKGGVSCDFPGLARLMRTAPAGRGAHPLQRRRRQRDGGQVQRRRSRQPHGPGRATCRGE